MNNFMYLILALLGAFVLCSTIAAMVIVAMCLKKQYQRVIATFVVACIVSSPFVVKASTSWEVAVVGLVGMTLVVGLLSNWFFKIPPIKSLWEELNESSKSK